MTCLRRNDLTLVTLLAVLVTIPTATTAGPQYPPPPISTPLTSGLPESWEGGQQISTYSTVNLVNGNVITVIPVSVSVESRIPGHNVPHRISTLTLTDIKINQPLPSVALEPIWPDDTIFLDVENQFAAAYLQTIGMGIV